MNSQQIKRGIAVTAGIAIVVLFFIFNPFAMQFLPSSNSGTSLTSGTSPTNDQLVIQDAVVGKGATAQTGDMVTVNYTGKLENGSVFDTSVGHPPYKFILGNGQVIPGWDQGIVGMKVGGKRILIIPASLAYGAQGNGPIPPGATLTFEVELVSVTPASNVAPFLEGVEAQ